MFPTYLDSIHEEYTSVSAQVSCWSWYDQGIDFVLVAGADWRYRMVAFFVVRFGLRYYCIFSLTDIWAGLLDVRRIWSHNRWAGAQEHKMVIPNHRILASSIVRYHFIQDLSQYDGADYMGRRQLQGHHIWNAQSLCGGTSIVHFVFLQTGKLTKNGF